MFIADETKSKGEAASGLVMADITDEGSALTICLPELPMSGYNE